jgi:hypothetical protein
MTKMRKLLAVAGVALGTETASAQPVARPAPPPPMDYAATAEKIVATSANVKDGGLQ